MKKLFLFISALCLSTIAWAGANDLLWDYTENKIPQTTPYEDNGFYYSGYVNDAPSAGNGLNGVKLNSKGWAYFEKAAVAGKLKMVIGVRSGNSNYAVSVYRATKAAGANPVQGALIADTEEVEPGGSVSVDLPADATGICIVRKTGAEGVLCKVQFTEAVARTFQDFEMVMESMPTGEYEGTVPDGVVYSGTANTDQHGYRGFIITVPVDGTVKFTLGDCQFGDQAIPVKNKAGETIATLSYPAEGCYGAATPNNVFTYTYIGGADTLTFGPVQYMNYFKAVATEVQEAKITYKDQNGTELSHVMKYEGYPIGDVPHTVADLTIPDGQVFRGWVYNNGVKVQPTDLIEGNTSVNALVTPIETVTVGSIQTYDFRQKNFYPEDHETVTTYGGAWHDVQHGWYFDRAGSINVQVAGKAVVVVEVCTESDNGFVVVYEPDGTTQIGSEYVQTLTTPDGKQLVCNYDGAAGWINIAWTSAQYIHRVIVYNVLDFVVKDPATGYYMVPENDAASLIMAIVNANAEGNAKIFIPNGTYDLGETTLTAITANNISLIGESMEGVVIKNKAIEPGIGTTATILINDNISGTYMQDLTLKNEFDYYKNNNGVAVALQDKGGNTICKNVRLLSHQDTYYSNKGGKYRYFEDCEIHGTVDFICGDGSVYFKNNLLYCKMRKTGGGGEDAVTASNAATTDKGYSFDGCTIKSECPTVSLGRMWNNSPACVYRNTIFDYSAGNFGLTKSGQISRWTHELMSKDKWPQASRIGEYNTMDVNGTVISPSTNVVPFFNKGDATDIRNIETILTAAEADAYSYENFFSSASWDPAAIAEQATATVSQTGSTVSWTSDATVFLVYADDELIEMTTEKSFDATLYADKTIYVRAANERGGFGVKTSVDGPTALDEASEAGQSVRKYIDADGRIVIEKDGKKYGVLGF